MLLSTVVEDGLRKLGDPKWPCSLATLSSLNWMIVSLANMIQEKPPLPSVVEASKDAAIVTLSLKPPTHQLEDTQQLEYDIRDDPLLLLYPVKETGMVIMPQNQQTLQIMRWMVSDLGLGKNLSSTSETDSNAIWNTVIPLNKSGDVDSLSDTAVNSTRSGRVDQSPLGVTELDPPAASRSPASNLTDFDRERALYVQTEKLDYSSPTSEDRTQAPNMPHTSDSFGTAREPEELEPPAAVNLNAALLDLTLEDSSRPETRPSNSSVSANMSESLKVRAEEEKDEESLDSKDFTEQTTGEGYKESEGGQQIEEEDSEGSGEEEEREGSSASVSRDDISLHSQASMREERRRISSSFTQASSETRYTRTQLAAPVIEHRFISFTYGARAQSSSSAYRSVESQSMSRSFRSTHLESNSLSPSSSSFQGIEGMRSQGSRSTLSADGVINPLGNNTNTSLSLDLPGEFRQLRSYSTRTGIQRAQEGHVSHSDLTDEGAETRRHFGSPQSTFSFTWQTPNQSEFGRGGS
ncbi:hypothetical protein GYMLUDRAFT_695314 [Collybiopsis luxurians FD-317 M1]|uniref:Uncharacterized protein n=1 Tax=Collybiopsis luxurians FD-317 M1 TaxID=944289 RepID=A0A0D0CJ53_9AGAR|nr:hypothetical protein GYMLUDRAFT_695314 [Collybiopsis luxurians FD-317 M1]